MEKSTWGHVGWRLELTDVPWMTVMADMGSDGAIWGRGSNQMTQEPGKVHMGSYGVEVRSERCLMDDSKS